MPKIETPHGKFDSKDEYTRYLELLALEGAGEISDLQTQVKYELVPKTDMFRAMTYTVDFQYIENGKLIVEDVKGYTHRTGKGKAGKWRSYQYRIFIDKRKIMYWRYGIWVHDVKIIKGRGVRL